MANSVLWYGHVLSWEDGHASRKAVEFEVEGQRNKLRLRSTWKREVEVEVGM